jgi:hypothetical protein
VDEILRQLQAVGGSWHLNPQTRKLSEGNKQAAVTAVYPHVGQLGSVFEGCAGLAVLASFEKQHTELREAPRELVQRVETEYRCLGRPQQ